MKRTFPIQWLSAAVFGLALSFSTCLTQSAVYTNILVQAFNDELSPAVISALYGNTGTTYDWSTEDADGSPSSGSLQVTVSWISTNGWQETQLNYSNPTPWPGLAVPPYGHIEFDVKVLSGDIGTNGTYGGVQFVAQGFDGNGANGTPTAVNWVPLGLMPLTSTSSWTHVSHSLETFQPYNLNQVVINFVAQAAEGVTNTITYLVDNIEIIAATNDPPTVTLGAPPVSGLHLVTPSSGSEFQRQNIRTIGTNFMWYGAGSPVTYSVTIGKYPNSSVYNNLQTHILLVPNQVPFNPDPDWQNRSVVRLDIVNSNNGGYATFRYKTNSPSSNGGYYGTNQSVSGPQYHWVRGSNIVGTWSLTFNQNTNVTVTASDGTSSNYIINAEAAAWFNTNNMRVYFGAQANNTNNLGQEVLLSGAQVTGAPGSVSDNFAGATLDTNKWQKAAQVPANVFQVLGSAYTLSWFTPDNMFAFVVATNLALPSPWQNSELTASYSTGKRSVVIPKGYPGPNQGYFALVKRTATKLLVLLPGETYAPGTTAGKTGSPTAQTAGVGFSVVVKTVDDKNYQAFSTDQIWLETPGDTNTLSFAYVPQLVLGSNAFNVTNSTAGSWTIRAVDQTDTNNIAEYVTGPYTVN